jgi:hypothetical protein
MFFPHGLYLQDVSLASSVTMEYKASMIEALKPRTASPNAKVISG